MTVGNIGGNNYENTIYMFRKRRLEVKSAGVGEYDLVSIIKGQTDAWLQKYSEKYRHKV